eukprot:568223-Pyramimonas_sp.AAC.1
MLGRASREARPSIHLSRVGFSRWSRQQVPPPCLEWAPSHLELEDAPFSPRVPFLRVLGKAWADHCTTTGASDIAVSEGLADARKRARKETKLLSMYVSSAVAHIVELAKAAESNVVLSRPTTPPTSVQP